MKDQFKFLDHIAVAVNSLDQSKKIFEAMGISFSEHVEEVSSEKVKVAFAQIDQRARLELLEPTSADSSVAQFIQKRGPGIHHLCFRVDDCQLSTKLLKDQGFQLIYNEPQAGADHCLVNFIHPKSTGGILIELSQKLKD